MGNSIKTRGAVIVTRVSTGEQAEHGTSLISQLDACRQKAAALSIPIVAEYEDAGVSGALFLARQGMQSALGHIREGSADTLICANISRLSRDIAHQQEIRRQVEQVGGTVVFCDLNIDLSTPEGDLSFGIFGSFAQYERKLIRDRTLKGRLRKVAEGIQTQRAASPFGYHIVTQADVIRGEYLPDELGHYSIVEWQAAVVKRIFSLYNDSHCGTPRIASLLNRDGIPTPKGGCLWQPSSIRSILLNPVYKGTPVYGRKQSFMDEDRLRQTHPITGRPLRTASYTRPAREESWIYLTAPSIVDTEVWQAVQDRFAKNQSLCGGNPRQARMLSGRVRCPECGASMITGGRVRNSDKSYMYYSCSVNRVVRHGGVAKGCSNAHYDIAVTEQAVIDSLQDAIRRPEAIAAAVRVYAESQLAPVESDPRKRIEMLNRELEQLSARETAVVKAQIEGVIAGADTSAYLTILADIAVRRKDAEGEIGKLNRSLLAPNKQRSMPQPASSNVDPARLKADLNKVLKSEKVTGAEKRDVVAQVIERVVCRRGGADVYFLPGLFLSATCQNIKTGLYYPLNERKPCARARGPGSHV